MLDLGLNDEGLAEFPAELHPYCGSGLRIWQYPIQFGPYLRYLTALEIRSYLEVGIRHGGSYVATVEALNRFRPLDWSVGIDVIDCPSMKTYAQLNPRSSFACLNTKSTAFAALLETIAPIDLVFIDSHHEAEQCRAEVDSLRSVANIIALHDIDHAGCPGVLLAWNELKASDDYECVEFTAQYPGLGPFMGIGVAVRKDRRSRIV
ncbi:MAG: class I SAM-dependent methyltransferase [Rhodopila sp.]